MDDTLRTKYTEIEVPLGAIQFEGLDPSDPIMELQRVAVEIEEAGREIKAAAARGEVTLTNRQERSDLTLAEMQDAARSSRALLTHLRVRSQTKTAARSFATFRTTVRRAAPRRLTVRRHRRAARKLQATGTDDGSSPEPPPTQSDLIVACAALALLGLALLAGLMAGASIALALPVIGLAAGEVKRLGYSIREVGEMLGLGKSSVFRLVQEHVIGHVRAGDRIIITNDHLAEFLKVNDHPAKPARPRRRGGR